MSSILRDYLNHATRAATRDERVEVVQNLVAELLSKVAKAGDRSPAEALEVVKSCDRTFRDFAKHPSTFHDFRIDPFGFRGAIVTGYDAPATALLFAALGWDIANARQSAAPWDGIK